VDIIHQGIVRKVKAECRRREREKEATLARSLLTPK
jgi:hypothetical protein